MAPKDAQLLFHFGSYAYDWLVQILQNVPFSLILHWHVLCSSFLRISYDILYAHFILHMYFRFPHIAVSRSPRRRKFVSSHQIWREIPPQYAAGIGKVGVDLGNRWKVSKGSFLFEFLRESTIPLTFENFWQRARFRTTTWLKAWYDICIYIHVRAGGSEVRTEWGGEREREREREAELTLRDVLYARPHRLAPRDDEI